MTRIKKLIDKFRKWLIVKLGGYVYPYSEVKYHKENLTPIAVCASYEQYRDDTISEEYLKEYLARKIADEIKKQNLYEIENCKRYEYNSIIHKMKIIVVDPKECENWQGI